MMRHILGIAILAAATSANAAVVGIDQVYNLPGNQQSQGIAVIGNDVYSGGNLVGDQIFDKNNLAAGPTGSISSGIGSNDATGIGDRLYWLESNDSVKVTDLTGSLLDDLTVRNDSVGLGSANINGTNYLIALAATGFNVYDTAGNGVQSNINFSQSVANMTGGDAWAPAHATSLSDLLVFASDDGGTIRVFDGAGQFMEEYNTRMSDTADVEYDGERFYGNTSVSPLPFVPSEVYRTDVTTIPEPASLALAGLGGLMLIARRR